jgi:hypothetical protein
MSTLPFGRPSKSKAGLSVLTFGGTSTSNHMQAAHVCHVASTDLRRLSSKQVLRRVKRQKTPTTSSSTSAGRDARGEVITAVDLLEPDEYMPAETSPHSGSNDHDIIFMDDNALDTASEFMYSTYYAASGSSTGDSGKILKASLKRKRYQSSVSLPELSGMFN